MKIVNYCNSNNLSTKTLMNEFHMRMNIGNAKHEMIRKTLNLQSKGQSLVRKTFYTQKITN